MNGMNFKELGALRAPRGFESAPNRSRREKG